MTEYTVEEKQKRFIEFLFMDEEEGGAAGNPQKAKVLAGYHIDIVNHWGVGFRLTAPDNWQAPWEAA